MNFKIGLALTGIFIFAACSHGEDMNSVPAGHVIGFDVYTGRTRGQAPDVTTSNLDTIYVTAYGNSSKYFENVCFAKQPAGSTYAGKWASTPLWYWPTYELTFYAYNTPKTIKTTTTDGYQFTVGSYGFTELKDNAAIKVVIPDSIASQQDLVAAYKASGAAPTAAGSPVNLTFKHYMTQIQVKAACKNSNYEVKVNRAKFANVQAAGSYNFATQTMTADKTSKYVKTFYTPVFSSPVTLDSIAKLVMDKSDSRWFFVPQKLTAWNPGTDGTEGTFLGLQVSIKTKSGEKLYPVSQTVDYAWVAIPVDSIKLPLTMGTRYNIVVNFFGNGGAGYNDPVEGLDGGSPNPVKGGPVLQTGNQIIFSVDSSSGVEDWADETTLSIDL